MRGKIWILAGVLAAMLLAGCGKKEETDKAPAAETAKATETPAIITKVPTPEPEDIPEGMVKSYLTGLAVPENQGRRRPIAVMLNNIYDACPQYGISRAGVVYEAPVEGNITRLMGIFEEYDDLEKIGSVRSCREYYIFFAKEFDALYAHFGQAAYAVPYLDLEFVYNLSGLSAYGGDIYYRTSDRPSPHNVYTSYDGIQRGIQDYGYVQTYDPNYDGHYQFARIGDSVDLKESDGAVTANVVRLDCFEHNKPWFEYDAATQKYKRFQFGAAQIDEMTGEQLVFDNILLQYTPYTPYDANGYLNLDVLAGGKGKYITHGKAIDVRWEKDSPWGVTHYINTQEQEITLNTGRTFVAVVLDDSLDRLTIQ